MIASFEEFYIDNLQEKDSWKLCDLMVANENRFKRFFSGTLAQNLTPELSTYFVNKKIAAHYAKEEFLFTIKDKSTNSLIGLIYIKELHWETKQGEFAYCIDSGHEGKGLISKALKELSSFAFVQLNLEILQIIVHKDNIASVKVAERCDFIWKKTLVNEFAPPNEPALDMELYELYK